MQCSFNIECQGAEAQLETDETRGARYLKDQSNAAPVLAGAITAGPSHPQ